MISYESYDALKLISLHETSLFSLICLSACHKLVKRMLDVASEINICKIPVFIDTIFHRKIVNLSSSIEENISKTFRNSNFAQQIDKMIDINYNLTGYKNHKY